VNRKRLIVAAGLVLAGALLVPFMIATFLIPPGPGGAIAALSSGASVTSCQIPALAVPSGRLDAAKVADLAARAGFRGRDVQIAVAVARAESDWNPSARNGNTNGSTDFGLMQINSIHASILAGGSWSNPQDNMVMAFKVFQGSGGRWTPWVTFNTGAFAKFLVDVAAPAVGCTPEAPNVAGSCSIKDRAVFATYRNGQIPASALCVLKFDTRQRLRADAANALVALNVAYRRQFGVNLCITDSYRSLAGQIDVRRRKGSWLTAVPGTSNHGWGLATDNCGPGGGPWIEGSPYDVWMHENAPTYGWVHPAWAEPGGSGPHEPWHWSFRDGIHRP
jgi:hypothetical protein